VAPRSACAAVILAGAVLAASACSSPANSGGTVSPMPGPTSTPGKSAATRLKHVVVIIQENRTVDNLFNGFCLPQGACADTVTVDPVTGTRLKPASLAAPYSPYHEHGQFVTEYDGGNMDGFSRSPVLCPHEVVPCNGSVFVYAPASETALYRQLATVDGVLADETFETLQGPSFPAHFYAIAGQSGGDDPDRLAIVDGQGTCASHGDATPQIQMDTPYPGLFGPSGPPCKDFPTIFDLLARAGHSWRYYSDSITEIRAPTQSIRHLFGSANYVPSSTRFPIDVAAGKLADVTYLVSPTVGQSDHPMAITDPLAGPEWVASVVNAVGETPFWNTSAIVIWWDDWGGFFDHVRPPASPVRPDPFEYGFRVPLLVASPYARVGTIDHTPRTFVGALRLIEEVFGLPSLHTTDQYEPDGLDSAFDFNRAPVRFTPLGGPNENPFSLPVPRR
jgi:phospholipase C